MQCMKCGREIETEQIFCDECLVEMEKYPVKPDIVVQLPPHTPQIPVKKPANHRRHPAVPLEEQVKRLKKTVVLLSCSLALAIAAVAGLGYLTLRDLFSEEDIGFLPGQNYSSQTSGEVVETE